MGRECALGFWVPNTAYSFRGEVLGVTIASFARAPQLETPKTRDPYHPLSPQRNPPSLNDGELLAIFERYHKYGQQ